MGYVTRFTPHAQREGHAARWRLRVGDYRVVYTVENGQLIVWVLAVGNRGDICRQIP